MFKLSSTLLAAALLAPVLAGAQTTTTTTTTQAGGVLPSQQVAQLAPQLVTFVGGQVNFDSLVNGLALGTQVTLLTLLPGGQLQNVTFLPQGTMTPTQIAQTLENARQSLISRGIGTPTAQQVAVSLAGGTLQTQTGAVQVTGLLPNANLPATTTAAAGGTAAATTNGVTTTTTQAVGSPSPAAILQGQTGAGTTPPSPAQVLQNQRGPNVSDTPTPGNISNTPSTTAPATGTTANPATATTGPERSAGTTDRPTGAPTAAGTTAPATAAPASPAPAR